mmetsp:Transcript_59834/g.173316  ORF Transcript_59834/g.173316 Transcript_59834/m.173316 type:complete len:277 (-) Transcript_59834:618-1448(-)
MFGPGPLKTTRKNISTNDMSCSSMFSPNAAVAALSFANVTGRLTTTDCGGKLPPATFNNTVHSSASLYGSGYPSGTRIMNHQFMAVPASRDSVVCHHQRGMYKKSPGPTSTVRLRWWACVKPGHTASPSLRAAATSVIRETWGASEASIMPRPFGPGMHRGYSASWSHGRYKTHRFLPTAWKNKLSTARTPQAKFCLSWCKDTRCPGPPAKIVAAQAGGFNSNGGGIGCPSLNHSCTEGTVSIGSCCKYRRDSVAGFVMTSSATWRNVISSEGNGG